MTDKWYARTIEEITEKLKTDTALGLTPKAVSLLQKKNGRNHVFFVKRVSFLKSALQILSDFTTILLILTALVAAFFEHKTSAALICILLAISCGIRILTYIKSRRVIEDVSLYSMPSAKALRGGKVISVMATDIVTGDILFLKTGDIVPADARIILADKLMVSEAGITANSKAIEKKEGVLREYPLPAPEAQTNVLFAGSVIVSGFCRAVVTDTGAETLIAYKKGGIQLNADARLPMIEKLGQICRSMSLAMMAAVLIITILDIALGNAGKNLADAFITAMALAVASMSEFLAAFAYIFVSCSILRMTKDKKNSAMIKRIERIGGGLLKKSEHTGGISGIDCLILRENASIKSGENTIRAIHVGGKLIKENIRGNSNPKKYAEFSKSAADVCHLFELVSASMQCDDVSLPSIGNEDQRKENPDKPFIDRFFKEYSSSQSYRKQYEFVEHSGIGDGSKFETSLLIQNGNFVAVSSGMPREIIAECSYQYVNGREVPFTLEQKKSLVEKIGETEREGCRIVAVAKKDSPYNRLRRISMLQSAMCFYGFIAIAESLVPGTVEMIETLREAGIKLILLSDNRDELSEYYFAAASGFLKEGKMYVSCDSLPQEEERFLEQNAESIAVCRRLTPGQIMKLVGTLKKNHTVGFLGGPEDAFVYNDQEIVRFACDDRLETYGNDEGLVSFESNVSETLGCVSDVLVSHPSESGGGLMAVVSAIEGTRSVFLNLHHAFQYLMVSQSVRLFLMLYSVFTGDFVLNSQQMLFLGLICDFVAVIALAYTAPPKGIIQNRKLPESSKILLFPLLIGGITAVLTIGSASAAQALFGVFEFGQFSGFVFVSMLLIIMTLVSECMTDTSIFGRSNHNTSRAYVLFMVLMAAFIVFCICFTGIGIRFDFEIPSFKHLCFAVIPAILVLVYYEIVKILKNRKSKI